MKLLDYFQKLHKFFVDESYSFMQGTPRWEYYAQYPFAYISFMYASYLDYKGYKSIKSN